MAQTVLLRWSHLKGVTKSSSAAFAELKKERRWISFLCLDFLHTQLNEHTCPKCKCDVQTLMFPFFFFSFPQLCFDYQFDTAEGQHKIACHCGAPECRKWINWGNTKNNKSKCIPCLYSVDAAQRGKKGFTLKKKRKMKKKSRFMNEQKAWTLWRDDWIYVVGSSRARKTTGRRKGNVTQ